MDNYEYANAHMKSLMRSVRKRARIQEQLKGDITKKRKLSLLSDLNFLGMEISKDEERIAYALGKLSLNEVRDEYHPSGWHVYKGVREELEKLNF